jgi:hypothetical protein
MKHGMALVQVREMLLVYCPCGWAGTPQRYNGGVTIADLRQQWADHMKGK